MVVVKKIDNPTLSIRVSPDMNDRIDRVADMFGVTRGEIARIAIGQYVGQITGALDQMAKTTQAQAQSIDFDKMMEMMIPRMIEAFKEGEVVPAHVEQGRNDPHW